MSYRINLGTAFPYEYSDVSLIQDYGGDLQALAKAVSPLRPLKIIFDNPILLINFVALLDEEGTSTEDVWQFYRYIPASITSDGVSPAFLKPTAPEHPKFGDLIEAVTADA